MLSFAFFCFLLLLFAFFCFCLLLLCFILLSFASTLLSDSMLSAVRIVYIIITFPLQKFPFPATLEIPLAGHPAVPLPSRRAFQQQTFYQKQAYFPLQSRIFYRSPQYNMLTRCGIWPKIFRAFAKCFQFVHNLWWHFAAFCGTIREKEWYTCHARH